MMIDPGGVIFVSFIAPTRPPGGEPVSEYC